MIIKLFLPENPDIIAEKLRAIILDKMKASPIYKDNAENNTSKFLKTYSIKYYFFLDYIIKAHFYFDLDSAVFPREKMLKSVLGKIRWKLQGGKLFNIVKDDLLKAGYIQVVPYKSSKGKSFIYSADQGLATRFMVIGGSDFKSYYFNDNTSTVNKKVLCSINNYFERLKKSRENEIDLSDDLVKYNLRFMMSLDFSSVDKSNLSDIEKWQVEKFMEKDFSINNKSTGRTYSSFTNLKKTVRKNVLLDGERVIGVDISNSQIVFLSQVIKNYLQEEDFCEDTYYLLKYISLGKFYELIWKFRENIEERVQYLVLEGEDREEIKEKVFAYVYNDAKNYEIEVEEIFKEKFPQVYRVLRKIRGPQLARRMQSVEANIINTAYRNIIRKGIKAGTLFDSIYAKESDIKEVMAELKNLFKSRGIKAVLKYTHDDVQIEDLSSDLRTLPVRETSVSNHRKISVEKEWQSDRDSLVSESLDKSYGKINERKTSLINSSLSFTDQDKTTAVWESGINQIDHGYTDLRNYSPPSSLEGKINLNTNIPANLFIREDFLYSLNDFRLSDKLKFTSELNYEFIKAINLFNGKNNIMYDLQKIEKSIEWSNFSLHETYRAELSKKHIQIDFQNFLFKFDNFVISVGGLHYLDMPRYYTDRLGKDMFRVFNAGYQYFEKVIKVQAEQLGKVA